MAPAYDPDLLPTLREMRSTWSGPEIGLWGFANITASMELAYAFVSIFWPHLVEIDGGVFLAERADNETVASWLATLGSDVSAVEKVVNHVHVDDLFMNSAADREVGVDVRRAFAEAIAGCWRAAATTNSQDAGSERRCRSTRAAIATTRSRSTAIANGRTAPTCRRSGRYVMPFQIGAILGEVSGPHVPVDLSDDAVAAVFAERDSRLAEAATRRVVGHRDDHGMDFYLDYVNAVIAGPGPAALEIVERFASAAPDDDAVCWVGTVLVEPLLELHWLSVLEEFIRRATNSAPLRRALSCASLDLKPRGATAARRLAALLGPGDEFGRTR